MMLWIIPLLLILSIAHGNKLDQKLKGDYPLHYYCYHGNEAEVDVLISGSVDIDQSIPLSGTVHEGATPLHLAILNGYDQIVNKLLIKKADPNKRRKDGWTPLHYASNGNWPKIVQNLVDNGANVNVVMNDQISATPLHFSAKKHFKEVVAILLKAKADTSIRNYGRTVLDEASSSGDLELVKLLLDEGEADMYAQDENMMTSFHFSIFEGNKDIIKEFIDRGIDVNLKRNLAGTPMHDVAANGFVDLVNYILDKGGNINAVNDEGITPLVAAVHQGHFGVVDLLLQRGAELYVKGANSPIQTARDFNDKIMEDLLTRVQTKPVETYSGGDTRHFISSLGLSKYFNVFKKKNIEGPELIKMDRKSFEDVGVELEDAKKIVEAIEKLPRKKSIWDVIVGNWNYYTQKRKIRKNSAAQDDL